MHTPTIGEVVALIVCGVLIAAVLHAGQYARHATKRMPEEGHPKKGDRIRLLVGIPHLGLAPGSLGNITLATWKDGEGHVYFARFDNGVSSVIFYEHETWHFEIVGS